MGLVPWGERLDRPRSHVESEFFELCEIQVYRSARISEGDMTRIIVEKIAPKLWYYSTDSGDHSYLCILQNKSLKSALFYLLREIRENNGSLTIFGFSKPSHFRYAVQDSWSFRSPGLVSVLQVHDVVDLIRCPKETINLLNPYLAFIPPISKIVVDYFVTPPYLVENDGANTHESYHNKLIL